MTETDVDASGGDRLALAVLTQYRMATTEQMHLLLAPDVRIEQTRRRLTKLRTEGLIDRITLPQAGRTRVWFPTGYGVQVASTWPELRGRRPPRTVSDRTAVRLQAGHQLTVTETALAFVQDARHRGDLCRPLDWIPEVYHPLGSGEAVIPDALMYYRHGPPTATAGPCCGRSSRSTAPFVSPTPVGLTVPAGDRPSRTELAPARVGRGPRNWHRLGRVDSGMTATTPTQAPDYPYCAHGADPADRVGCRGRRVQRQHGDGGEGLPESYDACLAHLADADRDAYLASLAPGSDVDHRHTTLDRALLDQLLDAVRDPATNKPRFGAGDFSKATFTGGAQFSDVNFGGEAEFTGAVFEGEVWFTAAHFTRDAGFHEAVFARGANFDWRPSKATPCLARWSSRAASGSAGRPSPAPPHSTGRPSKTTPRSRRRSSTATPASAKRSSAATSGFC